METYLWKINEKKLNKTNLKKYSDFINKNYKVDANKNFNKIWKWSVENKGPFCRSCYWFHLSVTTV